MVEGKNPLQPPFSIPGKEILSPAGKTRDSQKEDTSFQKVLNDLIDKVSELEKNADKSIQELISGERENIHQVMTAAEEASLAFNLMMEIRNKLVEAYKEIMRMQI